MTPAGIDGSRFPPGTRLLRCEVGCALRTAGWWRKARPGDMHATRRTRTEAPRTHTRYVSACISTCYTPASADATVLPARIADTLPAYAVFPQRWTYQEFKKV